MVNAHESNSMGSSTSVFAYCLVLGFSLFWVGVIMIVYHVCSTKKLEIYKQTGFIKPPVRAWENIQQAERMSLSTGRRVILRLKFPNNAPKLAGHFNQARVLNSPVPVCGF